MYPKPSDTRLVRHFIVSEHFRSVYRYRSNENVAKTADKPADNVLLVYSFTTNDKIAKWGVSLPDTTDKFPYKIVSGKVKRKIRLYIAARGTTDLSAKLIRSS